MRIKYEYEHEYEHAHEHEYELGLEADIQAAREQEEARRLARQAPVLESRL